MTIRIDEELADADWLRAATWDLPTDVDELLRAIGSTKAAVARFMELPAARPMPPEVRRELERRGLLVATSEQV